MARLEIEIAGVNDDLKRVLKESKIELSNFSKGLNFKPQGVTNANAALTKTRDLLKEISALSSKAKSNLGGTINVTAVQQERLALAQSRTEAQNYRTESAKLRTELDAMRVSAARNRQSVVAASGSYKEAQQTLSALGKSIKESAGGFNSTDPAIKNQIRQYRQLNERLQAFDSQLGNNQRNVGNYKTALNGIKGTLVGLAAGAFSIGAIANFGQKVIEVTAAFQKFRAVLGNTLGSTALADLKLKEIQDFAAKTPFGVNELTEAFVKLANSGFKPTGDQMTALGDLAASTGKSFDQLAEAILDAQGGEFERLKEFGVRAKDAGDSVIFTYKGVQTTVEKTSGSIREYITNLGKAQGVSGSMAVISETLGGKISNLGDSWDQMLNSVGKNTDGVFKSSIDIIGRAIDSITEYNRELEISSKYNIGRGFGNFLDTIYKYSPGGAIEKLLGGDEAQTNRDKLIGSVIKSEDAVAGFVSKAIAGAKSTDDFGKALAQLKKDGDATLKSISDPGVLKGISTAYQQGVKAIRDARAAFIADTVKPNGNFGKGKSNKTAAPTDFKSLILSEVSKAENYEALTGLEGIDKTNEKTRQKYEALNDNLDKIQKRYNAKYKAGSAERNEFDRLTANARLINETNKNKELEQNQITFAKKQADIIAGIEEDAGITRIASQEQELQKNDAHCADLARQYSNNADILKTITEAKEQERLNIIDKYRQKQLEDEGKIQDKINDLVEKGFRPSDGSRRSQARLDADLKERIRKVQKYYDDLKALNSGNPYAVLGLTAAQAAQVNQLRGNAQEAKDSGFSRELSNAATRFGEDLISTFTKANAFADSSFSDVISGLATNLTDTLQNVFLKRFGDQLTKILDKAFDNLSSQQQSIAGGALILGSIVSGATKKTSTLGQGLGGALKGAGTGALIGSVVPVIGTAAGAIVGGIAGAIGGIFGSSKAKKQEAQQKAQLEEEKKQTALLERQNALAYSASIVGRQTTNGIVTGVEVNEFGQLTTTISGQSLQIILDRANASRTRGV